MKHIFAENLEVTVFLLAERSVDEFDIYHADILGTFCVSKMISDTEIELSCRLDEEYALSKKDSYVLYTISDRKVYICQAVYFSEYHEDSSRICTFHIVSPLQEIQRRMYQRIACRDEISYQEIEAASSEAETSEKAITEKLSSMALDYVGTMVDISGGGVRFVANTFLPVGTNLVVRILLDRAKERYMYLCGKVVSSMELVNEQAHYEIRMKYTRLDEKEKEEIIQYAFLIERENQQKKY